MTIKVYKFESKNNRQITLKLSRYQRWWACEEEEQQVLPHVRSCAQVWKIPINSPVRLENQGWEAYKVLTTVGVTPELFFVMKQISLYGQNSFILNYNTELNLIFELVLRVSHVRRHVNVYLKLFIKGRLSKFETAIYCNRNIKLEYQEVITGQCK